MEEEEDVEKFKDYDAQSSAPAESKPSTEPTSPKNAEREPAKASEPKVLKTEETAQLGDRIFSSPVARKLAVDNNVSY